MAKLLLLDGAGLDALLSDLTGREYHLYDNGDPRTNVMTKTLPGVGPADQWLRLIDGDHAWRRDGLPTFDSPNHEAAGAGNFPLYESCVLRERGFRALFDDWENDDTPGIGDFDGELDPAENFPDFGDAPSLDPNDPLAPVSTLTVGSPSVVQNGTTWVTGSTPLTLDATDDFWLPEEIDIDWRVAGGAFARVDDGTAVDLSGQPDGPVGVEHRAVDPCRTEDTVTTTLSVDNTPPTITIATPVADPPSYDTDDFVPVAFSATDGAGVGVDTSSFTVAIDGTPVALNHVVDTYLLDAGLHTVTVGAADLLGNSTTATQTFRVRATTASLINNLERARSEGDVPDTNVYHGLRDKLTSALRAHNRGQHSTEWNLLEAFVEQLEAQAGQGIDADVAERFIGYALDLIAAGG